MDVIVKWRDGSENCVPIKDLKSVRKGGIVNYVGSKVKMFYNKTWYYGVVTITEQELQKSSQDHNNVHNDIDSDDEPLINKRNMTQNTQLQDEITLTKEDPFVDIDIEDPQDPDYVLQKKRKRKSSISSDETFCADDLISLHDLTGVSDLLLNLPDHYHEQHCEAVECLTEVFSSCYRCSRLLCWDHFSNNLDCVNHNQVLQQNRSHFVSNNDETGRFKEISTTNKFDAQEPSLQTCSQNQHCEVAGCKNNVNSSCFTCECLVCWDHFSDPTCEGHRQTQSPSIVQEKSYLIWSKDIECIPENYDMEGSPREIERTKSIKQNLRKNNQLLKVCGKEYITQVHKKVVPEKKIGCHCDVYVCKRECFRIKDDIRAKIFETYWQQGTLQSQREFIIRHVTKQPAKRRTVGPESRRQFTLNYYFSLEGKIVQVCRRMFLNTLNISERTVRTALEKVTDSGTLEKDKRGGRRECFAESDAIARDMINRHIDRYPRVESHNCREKSTREYLHSDLTLPKMYHMFKQENINNSVKPSFSTYRMVFKSKNLSFHRPKKDQCSLCMTHLKGFEVEREIIKEKYTEHQKEKNLFHTERKKCKLAAQEHPSLIQCATFDLQQVISLPISNESAVFYKRRLSAYNFTIYDMASGDCSCYTWHEGDSKRGSSEISTALYDFLKKSDVKGFRTVYLFADGCSGQNKNSIVASTLLYTINNSINIQEIILRFSVPNHGQSEGDSVHSTIGYALKKSGDIIVPSQLHPVFRLARRNKPYEVNVLSYSDFLDFKKLSTNLRLLAIRKDDEGQGMNWKEIVQISVKKCESGRLFFKTISQAQEVPRSISLPRQVTSLFFKEIECLNPASLKISTEKYTDLLSLTAGETPVIKLPEHVAFYKSLSH